MSGPMHVRRIPDGKPVGVVESVREDGNSLIVEIRMFEGTWETYAGKRFRVEFDGERYGINLLAARVESGKAEGNA